LRQELAQAGYDAATANQAGLQAATIAAGALRENERLRWGLGALGALFKSVMQEQPQQRPPTSGGWSVGQ